MLPAMNDRTTIELTGIDPRKVTCNVEKNRCTA